MPARFAVDTRNLREFRRDLRRLNPEVDAELRRELKEAVGRVVVKAQSNAPRVTGALAGSYRSFVTQRTAGIRSRLPYAPVIEYGGTIAPTGTPFSIAPQRPVTRAVESEKDRVVNDFGDAVERAADRAGWR